MFADHEIYGNEDQNTSMELIDSKAHPAEPQKPMDCDCYIEKYASEVNKLRAAIAQRGLEGKDAADLILLLAEAEKHLDEWIDIRVAHRKDNNKPLAF